MLTRRQQQLLTAIVKEHIKTAEPVGSEVLVSKYQLSMSPATVRNEMLDLDKLGFLEQPHPSAGRIPTEEAYQFFIETGKSLQCLSKLQMNKLEQAIFEKGMMEQRGRVKNLAKCLAELSKELILVAFAENDFYYTGLSFLFSQPEFRNQEFVCNLSTVIDHMDYHLAKLYQRVDEESEILIGSKNPIDANFSLIITKCQSKLLGLLGPIRMRYNENVALIEYGRELLEN